MTTVTCDFVTLKTGGDCKNKAVWETVVGSTKVCGTHKAELVRVAFRGESKEFVRLNDSQGSSK